MKTLASILVLGTALTAMPALADPLSTSDKPIVLAGGQFCVGPACVGRDRDRDWGTGTAVDMRRIEVTDAVT
jgi:hypothetical protein